MRNYKRHEKIIRLAAPGSVAFFVIYVVSSILLGKATGLPASKVPVFLHDFEYPAWSLPALAGLAASGIFISLFLPGVIWLIGVSRNRLSFASLFHRSFVVNLIQAGIWMSLYRAILGASPSRVDFLAWQAALTLAGLIFLYTKRAPLSPLATEPDQSLALIVGCIVILVLLPLLLWEKVFIENLSGDGTECFEFSRSLDEHFLPNWDLENGFYGFYPAFMLFSYPIYFTMLSLGETEAAARLPVFFYLLGIYLLLNEFVRMGQKGYSLVQSTLLVGACMFFMIYHAFHSTYEVIVADIAEPTGVDTFFTFLAFSALFSMVEKERIWWGITAFLGTIALAGGLPFALALLAARILVDRPSLKNISLDALAFGVPWVGYKALVKLYTAYHPLGTTKWSIAGIFAQYSFGIDQAVIFLVVKRFVFLSGILPAIGLIFLLRKDRISRMTGFSILPYLVMLALFGRTHVHYLIPVCLLPAVVLLRGGFSLPGKFCHLLSLGYTASLFAGIILTFPAGYKPHTTYRQFGSKTLMLFNSYPEAVEAARSVKRKALLGRPKPIPDKRVPWYIGGGTWVLYADKRPLPGQTYLQILAQAEKKVDNHQGWRQVHGEGDWVLYYDGEDSIFRWLFP